MLTIIKGPYLQWATPQRMTIGWETAGEATGEVIYFATTRVHADGNGRFQTVESTRRIIATADAPRSIQQVTIPDLQPETLYHYQVRVQNAAGETGASEVLPFKTAVNAETPFCFAVTSETGGTGSDEYNREIFQQIERYRPDFLLMVGDSVCHGRQYADWERFFFGPARTLLHSTPFYLCLGNHEENAPWFYDFVAYPDPKNYYAFHYGNAHFIALDSTGIVEYRDRQPQLIEGAFVPGAPQYEFLVEELRNSQARWKIVFFHYPPYVSADYQVDAMRLLCPILEEYGVDLVFNSHTIVYERSHPLRNGKVDLAHGIVYVVAGGAGNYARWFHAKRAWHTAQALGVPHFVQVSIADRRLELQAIDYEGRLFDTLVLTKPEALTSWQDNKMTHFLSTYLPLTTACRWLRGNHHGHSTRSDGSDEPLEIARAYEAAGYDYFALSEHDYLLPTGELQPHTTMCLLPAVEVTSCFNQTLLYLGADRILPPRQLTPRAIMEQAEAAGGLFIFDHPNWRVRPDYATDELLASLPGLRGMEIYCGVIERLAGEAKATDRWDRLLSKGWRVFGHATDDQHEPGDYFIGWNQVQWLQDMPVTAAGILQELTTGRFYASTGVVIQRIGVSPDGQTIHLVSDADEVRWLTHEGRIFKKSSQGEDALTMAEFLQNKTVRALGERNGHPRYVRAECWGRGSAMAWSQPFWLY